MRRFLGLGTGMMGGGEGGEGGVGRLRKVGTRREKAGWLFKDGKGRKEEGREEERGDGVLLTRGRKGAWGRRSLCLFEGWRWVGGRGRTEEEEEEAKARRTFKGRRSSLGGVVELERGLSRRSFGFPCNRLPG